MPKLPDNLQAAIKHAATTATQETGFQPEPIQFDFTAPPTVPDWAVEDVFEREHVALLSGDTGAAKSITASDLVRASLYGGKWLGHQTMITKAIVLDEENPQRLVEARLKALGVENKHRARLRYFCRQGVAVGDGGETDDWLREQMAEFKPDLLVIDTLMAAAAVDNIGDNSEAVARMRFFRQLATEFCCAVLVLHHERKKSFDAPSTGSQQMLGARQWAGQADAHMTLAVLSDLVETEGEREGEVRLRRTFKWRSHEKDRGGASNQPMLISVDSVKQEKKLVHMAVTNEGAIKGKGSIVEGLVKEIVAAVETTMTNKEIAEALQIDSTDKSFKRALQEAVNTGEIQKGDKRGTYAPGIF